MEQQNEDLCVQLGQFPDKLKRSAFLAKYPHLRSMSIVETLAEAVRKAVRVDVPRALALADAAIFIAQKLNSKSALALGFRAKANAVWPTGNCTLAVDLYDQAIALFEEANNPAEVGRTLSTSIQSRLLLGDYEGALSAAERARCIFSSLGESLRLARLEINVANIYHRQNRFRQALEVYERAYQQLLPHKDVEGIAVALHNMAVCRRALDEFPEALDTYQRLRGLCEQNNMPLLVAQADYNVAFLFYLRGDYTQALELLQSARETYRKNGDTYHLGLCDLDQSEIYLELSLNEEAAAMAQNSFEQFQKLAMGFEVGRSLTNLAIALSQLGNASRASELFRHAKDVFVLEKNQVWPSLLDLYEGIVLLHKGDLSEARKLGESALGVFSSLPMPSKQALSLLLLARASLRNNDPEPAEQLCTRAMKLLAKIGSPILEFQARFLMGEIQEHQREPDKAYESYQLSRAALEALRSGLNVEELKIGLMKNRVDVYGRLTKLCLDRVPAGPGAFEEAFGYIEQAKSRSLRDLVLNHRQPPPDEHTGQTEIAHRLQDLRKQLNWYYHRIELEELSKEGASMEQLQFLKSQARAQEHEMMRALREQSASEPAEASLQVSRAASLAEIRAMLDPDTALLEFFSIGEDLFAAVVKTTTLNIFPLKPVACVAQRLRLLNFQMSKFRLGAEYKDRFEAVLLKATNAHLQALYLELIAPLQNLLEVGHLVIVPSGPLHSLPFHSLYDGRQYLIERYSVSYAPSATIYSLRPNYKESDANRSLILGIDSPSTPFIGEEVQAVASAVPNPEVLIGPAANERALRKKGPQSRLIHIATHGYFRQDNPMFSAIRLADSYLSLYDLYHMKFPVDLLTLSGCVTGLDVVTEGDELLGLTRGLLYAGAQSLLLSLWDVDDQSTSKFMALFYRRLAGQRKKNQAFRSAVLELKNEYAHPYYWAPFKLVCTATNA